MYHTLWKVFKVMKIGYGEDFKMLGRIFTPAVSLKLIYPPYFLLIGRVISCQVFHFLEGIVIELAQNLVCCSSLPYK